MHVDEPEVRDPVLRRILRTLVAQIHSKFERTNHPPILFEQDAAQSPTRARSERSHQATNGRDAQFISTISIPNLNEPKAFTLNFASGPHTSTLLPDEYRVKVRACYYPHLATTIMQ